MAELSKDKINIVHEKNKQFFLKNNGKISFKYPHIHDPNFQKQITLKKEFNFKYDGEVKDILKEDQNGTLCNEKEFTLKSHQHFVKRFLNYNSPYNGILLYHGMGSGKTCSAIGITEEYRKANKYNVDFKKILIVASPNVQKNFELQLFDPNKLVKKNGSWILGGCAGSSLLNELKNFNIDELPKERVVSKINSLIRKNYRFLGYAQFANKINRLVDVNINDNSKKKRILSTILNKHFLNCMIVIDEVHNIRLSNDGDNKKVSNSMKILVQYVKNMKLLFMSGTPMYNDPKEIIFILNLLIKNDKYLPISMKEIFKKDGTLIVDKDGNEIGKQRLMERANGYISYIRGDNPYNFPFKIYPSYYNDNNSLFKKEYPRKQFNNKIIEQPIQHLDVYLNELGDIQKEGYQFIIDKIRNKFDDNESNDKFEQMESFGYTSLQEPINSLFICYPAKEGNDDIYLTGKSGLDYVMSYENPEKDVITNYDYNGNERIFNYDNIGKYSGKLKSLLDIILNSEGIVLVYSQFIDAGLVPVALALEELGFGRLKHNNLLKSNSSIENIDAITMKPDKNTKTPAKYSMFTGNEAYSPNNYQELEIINRDENKNGELCKVVLISMAGSEGIDFKNLRQVHILEPWYNLNRIEQIVGRAIRNCSHKKLPLTKRNAQVFLHGSYIDNENECVDLMIYRYAEKKSKKIGMVQKVLKEISIDCLLNSEQMNFSKYLDQEIDIFLSTKQKIKYNIKDKPFTPVCDYSDSCEYKCYNEIIETNSINSSNYDYEHLFNENITNKIKKLFIKNLYMNIDDIIDSIITKNVTKEQIEFSLKTIIDNKESVFDKYMKKGILLRKENIILFRPYELSDSLVSIYDSKRPINEILKSIMYVSNKQDKTNNEYTEKENVKIPDIKKKLLEKKMKNKQTKANKLLNSINNIKFLFESALNNEIKEEIPAFYSYCKKIISFINDKFSNININDNEMKQHIINHIMEQIDYDKELLLVQYLLSNEKKLDDVESMILNYYKKFIHTSNNVTLLFLIDLTKKEVKKIKTRKLQVIPIQIFTVKNSIGNVVIEKSTTMDKDSFGYNNIESITKTNKQIHDYSTFMSFYEKDNEIVLKIKLPKGKGAVFRNKTQKDVTPIINGIYGENIAVSHGRSAITIGGSAVSFNMDEWEIMIEVMCRHYSSKLHNNKMYHLNKMYHVTNI